MPRILPLLTVGGQVTTTLRPVAKVERTFLSWADQLEVLVQMRAVAQGIDEQQVLRELISALPELSKRLSKGPSMITVELPE